MALNVNRAVADPFYRYKMPKLIAKVEGKGNGIKTVIANMAEIAKALERPPSYPTKYFGCELGAQTNVDLKNERYIVNGEHDANKLQDILDGFIKKFVLCPACENPETTLRVKKNQINSKCKACGHAFVIDNKHRLATFITKNPPKIDVTYEKVKEKANGKAVEAENGGDDLDHSSEGADDDDDWAPEPIEEEGDLGRMGKLVISKDLEKSLDERLEMLHAYFVEKKNAGNVDWKVLVDEAERLDLKQKAPCLLVSAFLSEDALSELDSVRKIFIRFTHEDNKPDKKAMRYLLGGIETLIMKHEAILLPKSPHIIKKLYDLDIVEEEAILAWGEKPSGKYVSKTNSKKIIEKCATLLEWLKNAEEDEETDEDEEEDDDINFQKDNKQSELKKKLEEEAKKREQNATIVADNGEEFDIENI